MAEMPDGERKGYKGRYKRKMANNINIRRVQVRIQEMSQGKIDMTDFLNDTN